MKGEKEDPMRSFFLTLFCINLLNNWLFKDCFMLSNKDARISSKRTISVRLIGQIMKGSENLIIDAMRFSYGLLGISNSL